MTSHFCRSTRSGFGVVILRRITLLSAIGVVSSIFACTSDVFTTEPQAGGAGAGGEGGAGLSGSGGAGQGGAPVTACDVNEQADSSRGVFVAVDGDDTSGDGSREKPFASPRRGVEAAAEKGKPAVYVGPGTYELVETLSVGAGSPVVELSGGWSTAWSRDCSPAARDKTVFQGAVDAGPVVLLETTAQSFRLGGVSIKTKEKAGAAMADAVGASLYGIWAKSATNLVIDNLVVIVGDGGDGGVASQGGGATKTTFCNGLNDCGAGKDASSTGDDGASALAGTFGEAGYQPSKAGDGGIGPTGSNGTPGGPGNSRSDCIKCGSNSESSCTALNTTVTSSKGECGCGGLGGDGGKGGLSGGASVALLLGSSVRSVAINNAVFRTGFGGTGAPGGGGGLGADGAQGDEGSGSCTIKSGGGLFCTFPAPGAGCSPNSSTTTTAPIPGGTAGGKGGRGGVGGRGGPGAGGPSYGIVTVGAASVEIGPGVVFDIGRGGQGAPGAPNGDSAERKAF